MVNSVGKKLQQARLGKQLSIEEAARVTRIRPDKLLDLEEDNYSNFPSMSYAKGFLLLYARFLGVDVRDFADTLHAPNPVSSDDYEYLNAAAHGPQPPPTRRPYHFSPRREHTILPVIVFGVLIAAISLAVYVVVTWERIGNSDDLTDKKDLSSPAASPAISTLPPEQPAPVQTPAPPAPVAMEANGPIPVARAIPVDTPSPAPAAVQPAPQSPPPVVAAATPAPAAPVPVETPAQVVAPPPTIEALQPPPPPPVPAGTFDPTREVRRAEPVEPTPPGQTDAEPPTPPPVASGPAVSSIVPESSPDSTDALGPVKELSILPIRKTMVTIRRDVAGSDPIFKDWLYPGAGPLKVSGHKFWIQVQDPGAVQITQDGQPLPSGQGDIQIE